MNNPPIKSWMKQKKYDPFEGASAFKECSVCREGVPSNQFFDNIEYASSVCNNCLHRYQCHAKLLEKFVQWSRSTNAFKAINSVAAAFVSDYSAAKIEQVVLSAIVHKAERKELFKHLIAITQGDSGDQLLLTEALEELSNLQDEIEKK